MTNKETTTLERFYRELCQNIELKGNLKNESAFLSFIKMTSNNRLRILEGSAINPGIISKSIFAYFCIVETKSLDLKI